MNATYSIRLAQAEATVPPTTEGLRTYNSDMDGVVSVDPEGNPVYSSTIWLIFAVVIMALVVVGVILRRRRTLIPNSR